MSSPSSPTLEEVIANIMENLQRERAAQLENQEIVHAEEVREEEKDMEGGTRVEKVFLFGKGVETFKKTLANKGFIEERGFKESMSPFKEEIERRGWEVICKHMEPGRRTLVKEFYANLGEGKNLT